MSSRLLLPLAGLAMALMGTLTLELRPGALARTETEAVPARRTQLQVEAPSGATAKARGDVQARVNIILQRPLFRPDRRPVAGAAAAGPAALPRLSGILVSKEGKSLIFAGPGADGKPVVVAEGGRIGLYTVQSIDAGQATVVGPEGVKILQLAFGPPAATNAAAAPAPYNRAAAASSAIGRAPLTGAAPASSGGSPGSR